MLITELNSIDIPKILNLLEGKDAILFDLDGTILNSEPIYLEVINNLTQNKLKIDTQNICGLDNENIYKIYQSELEDDYQHFNTKKSLLFEKIITEISPTQILNPEIEKLLQALKGKKMAIVTASEQDIAHLLLKKLNLNQYFDKIITRQDVSKTKPSPEPYLLALDQLNLDPNKTIVFEDSAVGIQSAERANLDVIKVTWYTNLC